MTALPQVPPPSGFTIRRATNCDVPDIRAVLLAVRKEFNVLCEIGANDPDLDDLHDSYFRGGGLFEVVVDPAGQIVGCAGLRPLNPCRAELGKMYIQRCARRHPNLRAQRSNPLAARAQGLESSGGLAIDGNFQRVGPRRGHDRVAVVGQAEPNFLGDEGGDRMQQPHRRVPNE